jgi:DNA ligase 1
MFEKYDGLRGFWNPKTKLFYSRHGKPFTFPQQVIDAMPTDLFLDGEIWYL